MKSTLIKEKFTVKKCDDGERLDLVLVSYLPELSRRKVRRVVDLGGVYVNAKRVRISGKVVKAGDKIDFVYSSEAFKLKEGESPKLEARDILYDDHDYFAIHKPAGWPSVATQNQNLFHAEKLARDYLLQEKRQVKEFQLLHRLDQDTSGVLLFALSKAAAIHGLELFKSRQAKKQYVAVCFGSARQDTFHRSSFLSRIQKATGMVREVSHPKLGKEAVSDFKVVARSKDGRYQMVHVFPATGRSHQIRVHLAALGFPILGDRKYGNKLFFSSESLSPASQKLIARRHLLHAETLSVSTPSGQRVVIKAPLPADFSAMTQELFS